MGFGWQKRKSTYLPTGDLNVVKSSGARATFRCPHSRARWTCTKRHSRRFRNLGQRRPVVLKSFVKPSCSSLSSPSPSYAAPFGKLNPSNSGYLISQIVVLARFPLSLRFRLFILFNIQIALSSSLQSLASSPPSSHTGSARNTITRTINAWNQPPLGMAGVRFLPCTRCRTKRRRRLGDLPMSRNNTSFSSLTAGRGQY